MISNNDQSQARNLLYSSGDWMATQQKLWQGSISELKGFMNILSDPSWAPVAV